MEGQFTSQSVHTLCQFDGRSLMNVNVLALVVLFTRLPGSFKSTAHVFHIATPQVMENLFIL
jgi:hypothetical protein